MAIAIDRSQRRVLVIANETTEGDLLEDALRSRTGDPRDTRVLIVAPALNGRLRHWVSDSDSAHDAARDRLVRCVDRLARAGVEANGMIGDADPLQAAADALHLFSADEIVIATQPESRSNWLARRLVERARERFALPVQYLVVDGEERRRPQERGNVRASSASASSAASVGGCDRISAASSRAAVP